MNGNNTPLLVLSTCPGPISAKKIAKELVADGLAACVNIVPGINSYFRWGNKIETSEEHLLIIKTIESSYADVEERIVMLHAHEVPEVVAIPIAAGFDKYIEWMRKSVGK